MDIDRVKGFAVSDGALLKYDGKDEFVTVPEGVTAIWEFAFKTTPVKRLVLPSTLLSMDAHALDGCEVEFKEYEGGLYLGREGNDYFVLYGAVDGANLQLLQVHPQTEIIASGAFEGCKKLSKVILPDGIIHLGSYTFFESGLEEINLPESVESIGAGCFADCFIKCVTLPKKVTELNDCVFGGCACLTEVNLHGGVTRVGLYAFEECFSLESIDLGGGVTEIGVGAFQNCNKLKSVTVGDALKIIEACAFKGCVLLSDLRFGPWVEAVEEMAFEDCKAITRVELTLAKRIGFRAFSGCAALESIAIGEGISFFGKEVFTGCERLKTVEYLGRQRAWIDFAEEFIIPSGIGDYRVKFIK